MLIGTVVAIHGDVAPILLEILTHDVLVCVPMDRRPFREMLREQRGSLVGREIEIVDLPHNGQAIRFAVSLAREPEFYDGVSRRDACNGPNRPLPPVGTDPTALTESARGLFRTKDTEHLQRRP